MKCRMTGDQMQTGTSYNGASKEKIQYRRFYIMKKWLAGMVFILDRSGSMDWKQTPSAAKPCPKL